MEPSIRGWLFALVRGAPNPADKKRAAGAALSLYLPSRNVPEKGDFLEPFWKISATSFTNRTGGDVAQRIANARVDPTFLMADVEIVATHELYNINQSRLENLIHRIRLSGSDGEVLSDRVHCGV